MNAGYVRVSTNGQADGFGLEIQTEAVQRHARDLNRTVRVFTESGVSGAIADRPALADAIAQLEAGDVLVVPRLDRLARDLVTQELLIAEVRRHGAEVVSCAEGENAYLGQDAGDPSRKLIRQILGAVAEYERAMIALRTQAGKRAKAAAGGYAGGQPPYGYTGIRGELVTVAREQRILDEVAELVDRIPFGQIAALLNARGYVTRTERPWTERAVGRLASAARARKAGSSPHDASRSAPHA